MKQAAVVEPVDPFQGFLFDGIGGFPGTQACSHAVAVALEGHQACSGDAFAVLEESVEGGRKRHERRLLNLSDICD